MLFAPGPAEMDEGVSQIASRRSLPYFRGKAFAETVKKVSTDVAYLFQTESVPLPVTASGTGLMEMAVTNLLDCGEKAVVVNGGTFGQRWTDLCNQFEVTISELVVDLGKSPDLDRFEALLTPDVQAVFINMHETSTGYLYDIEEIGKIVHRHGPLFVVDGVSAIGADPFKMDEWHVDCALISTQKALALMPGLGYIAFSPRALERAARVKRGRYYFDALDHVRNMQRGMTPFTPAMLAILQVEKRMQDIKSMGLDCWIQRYAERACGFRRELLGRSDEVGLFPERSSNAMSAVALPRDVASDDIIAYLADTYQWWFAPNGTKRNDYLRVSHMGDLSLEITRCAAARILEAIDCVRMEAKA